MPIEQKAFAGSHDDQKNMDPMVIRQLGTLLKLAKKTCKKESLFVLIFIWQINNSKMILLNFTKRIAIYFLAKNFAKGAIKNQRLAFERWGVMADWKKQCYFTFDRSFQAEQIEVFFKMFERVKILSKLYYYNTVLHCDHVKFLEPLVLCTRTCYMSL